MMMLWVSDAHSRRSAVKEPGWSRVAMGVLRSSSMLQSMMFTLGRGLVCLGALRLYW